MNGSRPLFLLLVLAATAAIGFGIGAVTTAAGASTAHRYALRLGDKVTIPAVGQRCAVYKEGGAPELFCSRPRGAHHQVALFRDNILVYQVGNPDHPVWHGKP